MPDENGQPLPPIDPESLDGESFTTEINFPKCKHKFIQISPTEIRCKTCGVGYRDDPVKIDRLYKLVKQ